MNRPGFYFLICPDFILSNQERNTIFNKFIKSEKDWKTITYWGDEEPPISLWENLSQIGLFADKKILIIRHAELWPSATWKEISNALAKPFSHAWPFFYLESIWEKGKPKIPAHIQKSKIFLFASKSKWLWQSPGLSSTSLKNFVRESAHKLNLNLSPIDLTNFCAFAPNDAQSILNELEKLYLLSNNGKLPPDIIASDTTLMESNAFFIIKNIVHGNLVNIWKDVGIANESMLFFIIALFAKELRTFWQIIAGENVYIHPQDATRKKELARKLGPRGISEGFSALANAEYMVKSGQQTPEQSLENLALKLYGLSTS